MGENKASIGGVISIHAAIGVFRKRNGTLSVLPRRCPAQFALMNLSLKFQTKLMHPPRERCSGMWLACATIAPHPCQGARPACPMGSSGMLTPEMRLSMPLPRRVPQLYQPREECQPLSSQRRPTRRARSICTCNPGISLCRLYIFAAQPRSLKSLMASIRAGPLARSSAESASRKCR